MPHQTPPTYGLAPVIRTRTIYGEPRRVCVRAASKRARKRGRACEFMRASWAGRWAGGRAYLCARVGGRVRSPVHACVQKLPYSES
eukprot:979158-Alexandrium_andersonii.AAC.1